MQISPPSAFFLSARAFSASERTREKSILPTGGTSRALCTNAVSSSPYSRAQTPYFIASFVSSSMPQSTLSPCERPDASSKACPVVCPTLRDFRSPVSFSSSSTTFALCFTLGKIKENRNSRSESLSAFAFKSSKIPPSRAAYFTNSPSPHLISRGGRVERNIGSTITSQG